MSAETSAGTGAEAGAAFEAGLDRSTAALWGLALGDALGMPTQMLPPELIATRWGCPLPGFLPGHPEHPIAAGLPAGSITDDTAQAVLVAEQLLAGHGTIDAARLVEALLAWEREMAARGSLDLLGPSTRAACEAIRAGEPLARAGRFGDTNGAAMRIAPVGIAAPFDDSPAGVAGLLDLVEQASAATHNTGVALAGAAAVASAISAGIAGHDLAAATGAAVTAAGEAASRGYWVAGADVAARIGWAVELVTGVDESEAVARITTLVGTSLATQESVPAAFAVLAACPDDPWRACRLAAALGGDSDTIAAIAGAIAGACTGLAGFPAEAVAQVRTVNGLALDDLAAGLWRLRRSRADGLPPAGRTTGARP